MTDFIVKDILGITETYGYKSFWVSSSGEVIEGWTHVDAAVNVLGGKDNVGDLKNVYDMMYGKGWVRFTVEGDSISYDDGGRGMTYVQKDYLRDLSAKLKLPAFDDRGKLLK